MTSHLPDPQRPGIELPAAVRDDDPLVVALRRAGCVFAEAEASLLHENASGPDELDEWRARRVAGEPLEHIVGRVRFGDLCLSVGSGVFVPRQRSLLLAEHAVRAVRERANPIVLEAFCGVAPIAATVAAAVRGTRLHVADIDDTALVHARRNLPDHARVHHGPGLEGVPTELRGRLDVIAAVPPYVPDPAFDLLAHEARDHEPRRALTGGADGLDHVTALVDDAREWLSGSGVLLVEMNVAQFGAIARRERGRDLDIDAIAGDDGQTVVARLRRRTASSQSGRH